MAPLNEAETAVRWASFFEAASELEPSEGATRTAAGVGGEGARGGGGKRDDLLTMLLSRPSRSSRRPKAKPRKRIGSCSSSAADDSGCVEVRLFKPHPFAVLGISCEAREGGKGVLIEDLNPEGLAAKSKQLRARDIVLSIDGAAVDDPEEAATRLRAAEGEVKLVVIRSSLAPPQKAAPVKRGGLFFKR